jgi:hypothetical protein
MGRGRRGRLFRVVDLRDGMGWEGEEVSFVTILHGAGAGCMAYCCVCGRRWHVGTAFIALHCICLTMASI